jgi:hypothetical protein
MRGDSREDLQDSPYHPPGSPLEIRAIKDERRALAVEGRCRETDLLGGFSELDGRERGHLGRLQDDYVARYK